MRSPRPSVASSAPATCNPCSHSRLRASEYHHSCLWTASSSSRGLDRLESTAYRRFFSYFCGVRPLFQGNLGSFDLNGNGLIEEDEAKRIIWKLLQQKRLAARLQRVVSGPLTSIVFAILIHFLA